MPAPLSDLTTRLAPISDTPALDASVLLAHILEKPRTWVMAHPEILLTTEQQDQLSEAMQQLETGKPFPYVLGHWEFFGLDFHVTPDVLIPRPETELLVERAIAWLQESPARRNVADIGTGSGAIAISIAVNVPDANILATDISEAALQVAKRNAAKHHVEERIAFIQADMLPTDRSSFIHRPSSFDLICANLPYIPTDTLHTLPIYGHEPTLALDGGMDGLVFIRKLLQLAPQYLAPRGMILLEIEATRGAQATQLAHELFPEAAIRLQKDLAGQQRLLEIAT